MEAAPDCPRCGRPMVLRTKRGSGEQFYGCSAFPGCWGTRQIEQAAEADPEPVEPELDPGSAGGSAQREYERRVARREERIRGRWGNLIGGAWLALSDEPSSTRAWARGAAGERALAEALAAEPRLRALHDRRAPGTRGNIDHIIIGPAGVFVVDAKHYAGLIKVRDVGGWFRRDERLYVGRRDCSKLATNMGWQVDAVRAALAGAESIPPVVPVLCFINGDWPLFGAPDQYAGVQIAGPKSLRKLATASDVLDAEQTEVIARRLAAALPTK